MPTFGVIGKGNVVYFNDAGYSEATLMQAVKDAIDSFLNLDIVIVENPVSDLELDFSTNTNIDLSNVFSVDSGAPITVTIDGNTNSAVVTATISGNTLSITAGTVTGITEISIKGTAGSYSAIDRFNIKVKDPNSGIVLDEGFEGGTLPDGWLNIDADGDTNKWQISEAPNMYVHNGSKCFSSASWIQSGALTPDNWLITPKITLSENDGSAINYWICGQDASYAEEHYGVYVSTTGTDLANFTLLFEETITAKKGHGTYYERNVSLNGYHGDVYIAFRHFNVTDMFMINIDDITITTPTSIENSNSLAKNCELFQNYPNPFNPTTSIAFNLNINAMVKLTVFNAKGELVANLINANQNKGMHKVNFDASSLNSGVYYYTIEINGVKLTKKMLLVK